MGKTNFKVVLNVTNCLIVTNRQNRVSEMAEVSRVLFLALFPRSSLLNLSDVFST